MPMITTANTPITGSTLNSEVSRSGQGTRAPAGPMCGFQVTMILITSM
jgi:hypothetical protein